MCFALGGGVVESLGIEYIFEMAAVVQKLRLADRSRGWDFPRMERAENVNLTQTSAASSTMDIDCSRTANALPTNPIDSRKTLSSVD